MKTEVSAALRAVVVRGFDPACECVVCQTLDAQFPDLKSQFEIDAALRKASVGLRYVVVFAAGWFLSAVVSLARLKGWF